MYWFVAIHLLTTNKKSLSAAAVGHKRYQPIWGLMYKLHSFMGKCDDKYTLKGCIEQDGDFFSTEILKGGKR